MAQKNRRLARRHRRLAAVVVEAALGFAAEPAGLDVFHQQRTGPVLGVGQALVQHLHHRQAGIEADEVGELERPHRMVRAEPHRGVDRLDRADAFVQRVDRLVDHRQQDAVDDEGRKILRHRYLLAELVDERLCGLEGRVLGRDAADQFDQLHHRHRIHEMNADEFLRPVGRRREPRDRDRRRVGADDRVRLEHGTDLGQRLALDVLAFGHRLDHQIAVGELVDLAGVDVLERGLALVLGDALAANLPRHVAVDGGERGLQPVVGNVVEDDVDAGERADMRDAAAHLPGADDADLLNFMRHFCCPLALNDTGDGLAHPAPEG